jgi:DNA-binding beta-propeller fold protein YncE
MLTDPSRALLASVRVGTAPVGLALFDGGTRLIVADSDRFEAPRAHPALTVIDTAAALAHHPAVIATLRAGGFPREMAVEPNGRAVFVTDFASSQLETVNTTGAR